MQTVLKNEFSINKAYLGVLFMLLCMHKMRAERSATSYAEVVIYKDNLDGRMRAPK